MFAQFAHLSRQATANVPSRARAGGTFPTWPGRRLFRAFPMLIWQMAPFTNLVTFSPPAKFSLANFLLFLLSSSSSPCFSSLLTLSGDGAVYDSIILILIANLLSSIPVSFYHSQHHSIACCFSQSAGPRDYNAQPPTWVCCGTSPTTPSILQSSDPLFNGKL